MPPPGYAYGIDNLMTTFKHPHLCAPQYLTRLYHTVILISSLQISENVGQDSDEIYPDADIVAVN